jgi:hypothetical protein
MSNKAKTGERVGRGVLRSQKQTRSTKAKSQTMPAPTQRPTTQATVTLASGEKRTVEIEATNDKEWNELAALAEGGGDLSLDWRNVTHRTIAAIVALRIAHDGDEWKPYCVGRGMKWPKEVKSSFQPPVMWVLNRAKAKTGENHTSKASMIAGCIDDIWEYEMAGINGETSEPIDRLKPDDITAWLDTHGGYTTIYKRRRDRNKEPADKQEARYRKFLNLPPLEQRDIPDWLEGFAGDVVIAAHIDPATGKVDYRSAWQPESSAFWHGKLNQFIAARPDYAKAVKPVLAPRAEPMFDCSDGEAEAQESVQDASDRAAESAAMEAAAEIMAEPVAYIEADPRTKPVSDVAAAIADASDNNNAEPLDPDIHAIGHSDLDATIADSAEKQQNETESTDSQVQVETEAPSLAGPLVCKLAGGCHYGSCQGQRRCLAV